MKKATSYLFLHIIARWEMLFTMNGLSNFLRCIKTRPQAAAEITGNRDYPDIRGRVLFFSTRGGVLIRAEITGLPKGQGKCDSPIFAFHIHDGGSCTGNADDAFANAGAHFNPQGCAHPYHAGDLPALFSADGNAVLETLTDRFELSQIIGRSVIIHREPDDYTTQPSGNSGQKIACGTVKSIAF